MKRLTGLALFVLVMALAAGANAQGAANPLIGKQLYYSYCLVCHGGNGKSVGPVAKKLNLAPSDLTAEKYRAKSVAELAADIGGYSRTGASDMPKWSMVLDPAELTDIAAYITNLGNKDIRFTGDTRRGRIIYKNACVSCHGKFGAGDGHLANLINITMKDFSKSAEMKALNDDELIRIVGKGKGDFMPGWGDILSDIEIIDVAAYVRMLAR